MPGLTSAEKKVRLAKMSYQDFLLNLVKVDKQVVWFFHNQGAGNFCVGVDCYPALFGWQDGLPGFSGMDLEASPKGLLADLPGGHPGRQIGPGGGPTVHFPDGNATIARLLVRWLIPGAVPGRSMEDVGAARIDYAALDRSSQATRVRLNSTVVRVAHNGDVSNAKDVVTSYVRGGKTYRFRSHADDVSHGRVVGGSREPGRPASPADAGGTDRPPHDAVSDVAGQAAQGAAPRRPCGFARHDVRHVRAEHSRSARAQPRRRRVRS